MTTRLKAILRWTPNVVFFFGVCYVVPTYSPDSAAIRIIQGMVWFAAVMYGMLAYTTRIDDLIRLSQPQVCVPYILELVRDGSMIVLLITCGYYVTAWVLFMRLVAVSKVYCRVYEHYEQLFMEEVERANAKLHSC